MPGNDDIVAIALSALLWVGSLTAFVVRRRQAARWLVRIAAVATSATIILLHMGTGHRA